VRDAAAVRKQGPDCLGDTGDRKERRAVDDCLFRWLRGESRSYTGINCLVLRLALRRPWCNGDMFAGRPPTFPMSAEIDQ
jgi:hypothetical protein